jgi:hypothetical protein
MFPNDGAVIPSSKSEKTLPFSGEGLEITFTGFAKFSQTLEAGGPFLCLLPAGPIVPIPARRISSQADFPEDLVMRNQLSIANFVAGAGDCRRVSFGHGLIIERCRQRRSICRTDGQVLQEPLRRGEFLLGNPVNQIMKCLRLMKLTALSVLYTVSPPHRG